MRKLVEGVDYEVVWSGRDSLIPDRQTMHDERIDLIPSFDFDDGEAEDRRTKRKYTRTGKHVGEFTRKSKDDRSAVSGPPGGPDNHEQPTGEPGDGGGEPPRAA